MTVSHGGSIPEREAGQQPAVGHILVLLAAGLALRVGLIRQYPIIFGGDTVLRLVNYKYIVLSYQLPLTQAVVHYLHALTPSTLVVRWVMSAVGAVSGVGFYLLALHFVPRSAAFYGSLLFALNPFILPLSTVPYQEILMVTGLLFAFYGALDDRPIVASIGLGIACLTRYESWLACPILFAMYVLRRGISARTVATAIALFGWAPIAWIIYNGALTPSGSFAVETHITTARLVRWAYVGYVMLRNTPPPVVLLGLFGAWLFIRHDLWRDPGYLPLVLYLALFLLALLFSAHGTLPDTERRVTDREAHIPLLALSLLATIGLAGLERARGIVMVLCVGVSIWMSDRYLHSQTTTPELAISYQAARYLDSVVTPAQNAAILAKPIAGVPGYLGKVSQVAGDGGYAAALAILNQLETTPPNFQRILVHSRLGKRQLHSYASLIQPGSDSGKVLVAPPALTDRPAWIGQWNDFVPTSTEERELAEMIEPLAPVWRRSDGGFSLSIYRLDSAAAASPDR